MIPIITAPELIERYDTFFLDAYGVIVHHQGPLPGAREFLESIRAAGKRFIILSNDASRSLEAAAEKYQGYGLDVALEEVITSGSLIQRFVVEHGLEQSPHKTIGGTPARESIARFAGPEAATFEEAELLVVAGTLGFDLAEEVDAALSGLITRFDRGDHTHLLLPNPDVIYPKDGGRFGYTAGAVALLLEAGLQPRFPGRDIQFIGLGKPHRPIFEAALASVGDDRVVMVGDQLGTDIAGATNVGIDSALVKTGIARVEGELDPAPTWILEPFEE